MTCSAGWLKNCPGCLQTNANSSSPATIPPVHLWLRIANKLTTWEDSFHLRFKSLFVRGLFEAWASLRTILRLSARSGIGTGGKCSRISPLEFVALSRPRRGHAQSSCSWRSHVHADHHSYHHAVIDVVPTSSARAAQCRRGPRRGRPAQTKRQGHPDHAVRLGRAPRTAQELCPRLDRRPASPAPGVCRTVRQRRQCLLRGHALIDGRGPAGLETCAWRPADDDHRRTGRVRAGRAGQSRIPRGSQAAYGSG